MNNLKVKVKMCIVMLATIVAIVACIAFSTNNMNKLQSKALSTVEKSERENYDKLIKEQVEDVTTLCQAIYDKYQAGEYNEEEAKKMAADQIRELRYGESGYFWVDQYDGTNVVLLGNETEGTNRMNLEDSNGYKMVSEMINIAKENKDGGYADYKYPREGENEPLPKRSYTKAFEPFGWVVGTGNYTDDIDKEIASLHTEFSDYTASCRNMFIGVAVVIAIIVAALLLVISTDIVKSLAKSLDCIDRMGKGDFSCAIESKLVKRKDDFGKLANSLEHMRKDIGGLVGKVKNESMEITNVIQDIDESIQSLEHEIDNVSSTTEELAAGMEETAASSQQISSISHEIEGAAKSIALRSQDGAEEANDIRDRAISVRKSTEENDKRTKSIHKEISSSLAVALKDIEVVKQISVLAESIMDITDQTNLLALNASIEAARAGESGKGFAVVADEIRVLAEQSKDAVEHINEVTESVTSAVENLARDSKKLLEFVGNDVSKSLEGFYDMAISYNEDVEKIDNLVTDFSASSEELLASINGVMDAIGEVSRAATDGAEGTTDIAQRSSDVFEKASIIKEKASSAHKSAEKLKADVERFIL